MGWFAVGWCGMGMMGARHERLGTKSRIFLCCESQAMPLVISSAVFNLYGFSYSGSWRALLQPSLPLTTGF